METLRFLAGLLVFLGIVACSQTSSPKGSHGPSKAEMTEREKLEKDIALRNETESKMMNGDYLHDGALNLAYVGDIESVPALLVVLEENPPSPNGVMVCTAEHAITTLKKITGADAGITHKEWAEWWKQYKQKNKIASRLEKSSK